jgi:pyruvate dehydrogenase E2 component (dihydrolipoamide acetyltransferase)
MIQDVSIPNIGENVESGIVVAILVSIGDNVEKDDGLIEFETDKALVEIPAPVKGRVVELLVQKGDELHIGDVVARLETADVATAVSAEKEADQTPDDLPPAQTEKKDQILAKADLEVPLSSGKVNSEESDSANLQKPENTDLPVPAAPSIRRLARELGIEIGRVEGTGPGGRISEKDVKAYVKNRLATSMSGGRAVSEAPLPMELPDFSRWGSIDVSDMTTVRRLTAESMSLSWRMIPHVTQFDQADITHVQEWLHTIHKDAKQTDRKVTITAVLLKVVAGALKEFPRFNASLDSGKQQIIFKDYIHIGLAVDTQRGLLVPVVRNVHQKSIMDIAAEINDLSERARNKRITPDEMEGGTFTVSNQGGIGGDNFTPIIYWPQAAILGVSRAAVKPRYLEGEWHPRTMLPLSLSYDHRLNDGADAARFLGWICHALEYPMMMQ